THAHAQNGEHRAHAMREQRAKRRADVPPQLHRSASTGWRLAARRAGKTPATSPVTAAEARPISTAPHENGALIGMWRVATFTSTTPNTTPGAAPSNSVPPVLSED